MVRTVKLGTLRYAALIICCIHVHSVFSASCGFTILNSVDISDIHAMFNGQGDGNNWTVNDSSHHSKKKTLKSKTCDKEYYDQNTYQHEFETECLRCKATDIIWGCLASCRNSTIICNDGNSSTKTYSLHKEESKDHKGNNNEFNMVLMILSCSYAATCVIVVLRIYFWCLHMKQNEAKGNGTQTVKKRNRSRRNRQKKKKKIESAKSSSCTLDMISKDTTIMKENSTSQNEVVNVKSSDSNISTATLTFSSRLEPVSKNEICTSVTHIKQLMFSSSVSCFKSEDRRKKATVFSQPVIEPLQGITNRKQIEHERSIQNSTCLHTRNDYEENQSSTFLNIPNNTEEIEDYEETAPFKLLSDLDQEQVLSDLKLPYPSVVEGEETSAKGHSSIMNQYHAFQVTLSSGYPRNTYSSCGDSRKELEEENGSFPDDDFENHVENSTDNNGHDTDLKLDHEEKTEIETNDDLLIGIEMKLNSYRDEESKPKNAIEGNKNKLDRTVQKMDIKEEENKKCPSVGLESLLHAQAVEVIKENNYQGIKKTQEKRTSTDSGYRTSYLSSDESSDANSINLTNKNSLSLDLDPHDTDVDFKTSSMDNFEKDTLEEEEESYIENTSKILKEEVKVSELNMKDSLRHKVQVGDTCPLTSMEGVSETAIRKTHIMQRQKRRNRNLKKRSNRKLMKDEKKMQLNYRQLGNTAKIWESSPLNIQDSIHNLTRSCLEYGKDNFSMSFKIGCTNRYDVTSNKKIVVKALKRKRSLDSSCDSRPNKQICNGLVMLSSRSLNNNSMIFTSSFKECGGKSTEFDKLKAPRKMKRNSPKVNPNFGSFNKTGSFSNRGHERKEDKLGLTVSMTVKNDSGFCSGSIKSDIPNQKKIQVRLGYSLTELLHDCFKREISSQTMSKDTFQNLKVLRNMIQDEEERCIVKQSSREFHFTHQSVSTLFPGLNSYFQRLNNGPPLTPREQMHYEWLRLSSFHNYTGNGNALALARNGFYHDHNDGPNSTRCYLCEAQYSEWEMLDDIPGRHRSLSPNCPFHGNQEDESLNVSITYGEINDQSTRSSASSSSGVPTVKHSSSNDSSARVTMTEVSSSLQRTSISQAREGNSGGESISHQPTEDIDSDRSMLALDQPRALQALGRTGHSYASIMAPTRNNVASGARSNVGVVSGPNVARSTPSQIPGIRPSSILGGPVGAGAFAGPQTAVSRAKENIQQSNVPSPAVEAAAGTKHSNPAPGGGGRTDPNITVVVDNPKHPDYYNVDRRVNSYQGWPEYLDQTPRQMAEAGFFFVGVADFTRCFCCGGGLRNWEPGDDPVLEHTRWFPRCEYINKLKGERYVAAVQRRHEEHMAEQQRQQNDLTQRRDQSRNQPDPMTISAAITLQEMGYSRERTREAVIAVRQQTGQSIPSTEQVLTWLLDSEERETSGGLTRELGVRPQPSSASTEGTSTTSSSANTGTSAPTTIVGTSNSSTIISTPTTIVGTSIPSSIVNAPTTIVGTSIPSSLLNAAAISIPTTLLESAIPSSLYLTGFSVPTSIEVSTTIIGTANVNLVSSTSQISSGTTTSTVSSTSTSATPLVQLSASSNASTEEGMSAISSASGSSTGSDASKKSSAEKQQSGAAGDSDESKQAPKDASSSESSGKPKKKNGKKKGKNKPKSEMAGATGGDVDAKSLKEENEKLKEMQTCKICMERTVNTTLLPCGHLVCCETCAGRLQKCPICRKKIKGTVKTFMS